MQQLRAPRVQCSVVCLFQLQFLILHNFRGIRGTDSEILKETEAAPFTKKMNIDMTLWSY